jgi:2-polyprenyl-3-methyl-5-hydroxy-6-metoxy-1,4-benzoquinol methylase
MPFSAAAKPAITIVNRFPFLNAKLWDIQYRLGFWDELDSANGAQVVNLLEKHLSEPGILDLGCGKGLNLHLKPGYCPRFHGVDISASSIKSARRHARAGMTFEAADILRYETTEHYDAILLREVLYYLPKPQIPDFLRRISGFLDPAGKIFVQFWDQNNCGEYIDIVLNTGFPVLEKQVNKNSDGRPESVVVVLQPGR